MRIIKREAKPSRGVCVCPGHEHRPVSGVSSPPFAANVRTLGLRKRRLEAMPARLGEGVADACDFLNVGKGVCARRGLPSLPNIRGFKTDIA
ncbi:uncharacterized protein LOC116418871 isoform X2 [Piliocolobus tephrosceles]|uniref:uncharacterized protein LOC116418871 isoform X2 n=1 Tax=Piliocolobus tephrosceles TaxID=591936 RepID=UPI001300F373|nr:uncharacterized protein LOC116418871 isoform X2 [Piliocolobus tephrosceles]